MKKFLPLIQHLNVFTSLEKIIFMKKLFNLMSLLLFVAGFFSCTKPKLSSEKEILSFQIYGAEGEISEVSAGGIGTIKVFLPSIIDIGYLSPTITVSDKATVFPESGMSQRFFGFNIPCTYTVTAEDGSQQKYAVTLHPLYPETPLNDIPELYLQPLSVIQEQMQGKWKLQFIIGGIAGQTVIDKSGNYMHITKERIIWGDNTGIMRDSPIEWAKTENFWGRTHDAHYIPFPSSFLLNTNPRIYVGRVMPMHVKDSYLCTWDFVMDGYNLHFTKYE